jgi:hypothetical protein
MPAKPGHLEELVAKSLSSPTPDAITAIGEAACAAYGDNAVAVLAYGSCLRQQSDDGGIVDLYLLVDSYGAMPENAVLRWLNRLIPPNVHYLECPFEGRTVRAKCAVVGLRHFERLMRPVTRNPYFWARFSQPSALVYCRDDAVRSMVVAALARAARTMLAETLPLMPGTFSVPDLWAEALGRTYNTEWRAEDAGRGPSIAAFNTEYFERITPAVLAVVAPGAVVQPDGRIKHPVAEKAQQERIERRWARRRITGRLWASARLIKAAFTFRDGLDYLLWKIARHSGVTLEPTPFQRRHPVLCAPFMAWKLYRLGGFR